MSRFSLACLVCLPVLVLAVQLGGLAGILFAAIFVVFLIAVWESDR